MASPSPTQLAVTALADQLLSNPLAILRNPSSLEVIELVNRLVTAVGLYKAAPLTGPEKTEVVLGVLRRIRDFDLQQLIREGKMAEKLRHETLWETGLLTAEALIPVLVAAYKASPAVIGAVAPGAGGCFCCP